jgi:hypothetical protein
MTDCTERHPAVPDSLAGEGREGMPKEVLP